MRKTIVTLVSDHSGADAGETVTFGLDGMTYEIDLTADEAAGLRPAMESYVTAIRRGVRGARCGV